VVAAVNFSRGADRETPTGAGGPRPQHAARPRWSGAFLSLSTCYAAADRDGPRSGGGGGALARENNLLVVVEGGGHGYQGTSNSTDSLLIHLSSHSQLGQKSIKCTA